MATINSSQDIGLVAEEAFGSVKLAVERTSVYDARRAADLYADLDDLLCSPDTNPISDKINPSDPKHPFKLQRAIGGPLADSVLYRQGTIILRKFELSSLLAMV